jgi:hypothetical protein
MCRALSINASSACCATVATSSGRVVSSLRTIWNARRIAESANALAISCCRASSCVVD